MSQAFPSLLSLPPKRAKSFSLFRAWLKCHPLWEAFSYPSSKENSHPSCWLPQLRIHSLECSGAESIISTWSLGALIDISKTEASHLYLSGSVLGKFKKRRCKVLIHSADTQSVPNKRCLELQVQPANPAGCRRDVSGTFQSSLQLFPGVLRFPPRDTASP